MASCASFGLEWSVFECERALFIAMALDTGSIAAECEFGLFRFKSTVCIVAVAALHHSLKDFVMERLRELCFGFRVATHTKLRLALF